MLNTDDAQRRYEENCQNMRGERLRQLQIDMSRLLTAYNNKYHRLRINQAYRWDVKGLMQDDYLHDLNITETDLIIDDIDLIMSWLGETPGRELVLISGDLMDAAAKIVNRMAMQTMFSKAAVRQNIGATEVGAEPMNDAETISLCQGVFVPSWGPIAAEIAAMGKRATKAAKSKNPIEPFIYSELYHALNLTRGILQSTDGLHKGYERMLKSINEAK